MTLLGRLDDRTATARAIERNAAELLMLMGRAGGGEQRDEHSIRWTIGGSPIDYHNAVVEADLAPDNADAAIAEVIATFRRHNVPGSWHLTEAMHPPDLRDRLLAHGFTHAGDEPGMAIDLNKLPEMPTISGLRIARVTNDAALDLWASTLARGFGEGEREATWVGDIYRQVGLDDASPFRHYFASLDSEAVATASLFMDGCTAGIYFVMTVPEARRKGIGAAITLAALLEARDLSYHVGVLGSSEMGASVYRGLGFEEFCRIGSYEWRADASG